MSRRRLLTTTGAAAAAALGIVAVEGLVRGNTAQAANGDPIKAGFLTGAAGPTLLVVSQAVSAGVYG
ncbi:MAG TPA: twin-arginine translocation signal domain-containing protein, partial [Chloroflexota bacterium]|nr:twin-arginine translocation signal domain-containing protein [Chloroflexota bacterium]